jgi:Uncharacterized conserved protein (DUF2190)
MVQFNQLGAPSNTPYETTVKNYGGSDIASGVVVSLDTSNIQGPNGTPPGVALPASGAVPVFGVTLGVIAAGKTGRVRCSGFTVATAGAALNTVGVTVMATSAGKVIAWTTTNVPCGHTVSQATADTESVLVMFHSGAPATSSS